MKGGEQLQLTHRVNEKIVLNLVDVQMVNAFRRDSMVRKEVQNVMCPDEPGYQPM